MAKGSFDATDLIAPLMLRIPLGLIFMAHGSQKLLGLFGGKGPLQALKRISAYLQFSPCWRSLPSSAEDSAS
jgi:putative oxidoreductase